ncbi:MAG: endonuclease/exonuclease/phosphatase family protein [Bacteroidetes bacterium]|nr:endonuclease/exonuclease/phosphatase family protein [Bacteroidota bacterium]
MNRITPISCLWIISVSLLLSTLLFSSCSNEVKNKPPIDSNLRILTYNVWYGFTEVPERKALWLTWMKDQKADIVFMQELNEYTPEKLKTDAATWGHQYSVLLKEGGFPTGMTSRFPIEEAQRFTEGFHHGLIRAMVNGIYYYTIHLHPSNWEFRKKEIDLILADIGKLPSDANIVLAGDFNTFSPLDSSYYSHGLLEPFFEQRDEAYNEHNLNGGKLDYTALIKLMDGGFVDIEHNMRKDGYIFTGSFPTLIEKPGDHGSNRRLDYVFANDRLLQYVYQASVIADDTTQFLSDHLPVIVDFRIN